MFKVFLPLFVVAILGAPLAQAEVACNLPSDFIYSKGEEPNFASNGPFNSSFVGQLDYETPGWTKILVLRRQVKSECKRKTLFGEFRDCTSTGSLTLHAFVNKSELNAYPIDFDLTATVVTGSFLTRYTFHPHLINGDRVSSEIRLHEQGLDYQAGRVVELAADMGLINFDRPYAAQEHFESMGRFIKVAAEYWVVQENQNWSLVFRPSDSGDIRDHQACLKSR